MAVGYRGKETGVKAQSNQQRFELNTKIINRLTALTCQDDVEHFRFPQKIHLQGFTPFRPPRVVCSTSCDITG